MQSNLNIRCFRAALGLLIASNGLPAFAALAPTGEAQLIDIRGGREPLDAIADTWVPFDPDVIQDWEPLLGGSAREGVTLALGDGNTYTIDPINDMRWPTAMYHAGMFKAREELRSGLETTREKLKDYSADSIQAQLGGVLLDLGEAGLEACDSELATVPVSFFSDPPPAVDLSTPDAENEEQQELSGSLEDLDLTNVGGVNLDEVSRRAGPPQMPEKGTAPVLAVRNADGTNFTDDFTGSHYYVAVYENGSIVMEFVDGPVSVVHPRSDMYTEADTDITSLSPVAAFNKYMTHAGKRVVGKEWEIFDPATGESLAHLNLAPVMELNMDTGLMFVRVEAEEPQLYAMPDQLEPALAMDSAVGVEPQPEAGTTVVLALRRGDGQEFDGQDEHGAFHYEITSDGNIWTHHADGVIQSLVRPEEFPTTPKEVGRTLAEFLGNIIMPVSIGQMEGFNHETGEKIAVEDLPALGWDGEKLLYGNPDEVIAAAKAGAERDGVEAVNLHTMEAL
jgi:hypothetical protein